MTDPHPSRSTADWARDYLERGWQPVPIPKVSKGPNIKGWQNLVEPVRRQQDREADVESENE